MLNGIHLVDFGNHRDTRLTFGRMTALVGQNGAGKTNVMRAVLGMGQVYDTQLRPLLSDDSSKGGEILYKGNKYFTRNGADFWRVAAAWPGEYDGVEGDWSIDVSSTEGVRRLWRTKPHNQRCAWMPDRTDLEEYGALPFAGRRTLDALFGGGPNTDPLSPGTVFRVSEGPYKDWTSLYYKTAGNSLRGPSYSDNLPPRLSEDCRDLAWMIAYLKGDKDEIFDRIVTALREVVPIFRRVRHRPVAMVRLEKRSIAINKQERSFDEEQKVMGQELRFDMASGEDLPASAISEGTLITLAILTAVMQSGNGESSQTILLDDIESGLHPSAQRDLIRQLRKLQETRPELQIILTSHSPYIIDELEPEDVWLFAPDAEGIAHAAQLSQHPDLERARGVLTTGELWSAEGESWVLDPKRRLRPDRIRVRRRPGRVATVPA